MTSRMVDVLLAVLIAVVLTVCLAIGLDRKADALSVGEVGSVEPGSVPGGLLDGATSPTEIPAADTYAVDGSSVTEVQAYLEHLHAIDLFLRAHQVARWADLAECESGGDWSIVSRSGRHRGGLQMTRTFWATYGGTEFASSPELAEPWQQATVADRHIDATGSYRAWGTCARRLGLR
jgi:hypothetical protein